MADERILALLHNVALLLALALVSDLATTRLRAVPRRWRQVLAGAAVGFIGAGVMLAAFRLEPGIVFDARSILLAVSGLFLGAVPTAVAVAMTSALRLWQGGAAAWTGTSVIVASGVIGIAWRRLRRGELSAIPWWELYALGFTVHVVMLALMFTLPWATAVRVVEAIALPVLLFFPLGTAALGALLSNRLSRQAEALALRESEERHRSLFENSHAVMFIVDPDLGTVVDANPAAVDYYGWDRSVLRGMRVSEINVLPPEQIEEQMALARTARRRYFQFQHRLGSGEIRDVEVFSGPITFHGRQFLFSIVHDVTDRRRAEAILQERERRFQALFEQAGDGIFLLSSENRHVDVNARGAAMLSYARHELLSLEHMALLAPQTKARYAQDLAAMVEGRVSAAEWIYVTRAGDRLATEVTARRIDDDSVLVAVRDITERRQARVTLEHLLEESARSREVLLSLVEDHQKTEGERRLQVAALEAAANAILITDETGAIQWVNPAFCALSGYARDECLGRNLRELIRSGLHDRSFYEHLWRTILDGRVWRGEIRNRRKDGTLFIEDGTITPVLGGDGAIRHFVAVKQDVTERKRAEEELRWHTAASDAIGSVLRQTLRCTSEAEVARHGLDVALELCDSAKGFVGVVDSSSRFELLASTGPGSSPADALESEGETALDPEREWARVCGRGGQGFVDEGERKATSEDEPGASSSLGVPLESGGETIGLLCLAGRSGGYGPHHRHALERLSVALVEGLRLKRGEREQERLHEQLSQARRIEAVGRLAGGIAHDFNNALGVILGRAEIAMKAMGEDDPQRGNLATIHDAALRSANLTRQLLAFSRQQPVEPRVLDLNDAVAGMLRMLRRLIGEDIELSWRPGAELWPIRIDPAQVDQILANLLVNSRDAISGVGRVSIETQNSVTGAEPGTGGSLNPPGEYVTLVVSDDGCGMTPEVLEHVFEPFFTTKALGQGTGLGLATVYGIVQQNAGAIDVVSAPGAGTTFRIRLPRESSDLVSVDGEGGASLAPTPRGEGETVLLVEDEPTMLEVATEALEDLGYAVLAAPSPAAAMEIAERHAGQIHILITDVIMPGMNGRELAERLVPSRPAMRCLFLSGYTADVIAHRGVLDEGIHFLQKPFSLAALAQKVRETLDS